MAYAHSYARALIANGRPVKTVCRVLRVARSHIADLTTRLADWTDGRTARISDPAADLKLIDAVRAEIGDLSTYGYRRRTRQSAC
jgi:hypothetical protein